MAHVRTGGVAALGGVHRLLLAFPTALFTSALVTDIAYLKTAEIQWTNFSAWLICGALVFGGLVGAWAIVGAVFSPSSLRKNRLIYLGLLAAAWILGLINAFKHSQDAWSSVGAFGLILSLLSTVLILAAAFLAYSGWTSDREIVR
jgi:uncharacterized membrane protein